MVRLRSATLLLAAAFLSGGCRESTAPPATLEERESGSFGLGPVTRVRVANDAGPIRLEGEAVGPVVRWTLDKRVTAPTADEARDALDAIGLQWAALADSGTVRVVPSPLSSTIFGEAALSLGVPAATRCTIDSLLGPASVRYLQADVAVHGGEPVFVLDHTGNVLVEAEGAVTVRAALPAPGSCVVSSAAGNIEVAVPVTTSATVTVTAPAGTITVEGLVLTGVVQTDHSLTGTLHGGAGEIRLEAAAGNVALRALPGAAAVGDWR